MNIGKERGEAGQSLESHAISISVGSTIGTLRDWQETLRHKTTAMRVGTSADRFKFVFSMLMKVCFIRLIKENGPRRLLGFSHNGWLPPKHTCLTVL